MAFDLEKAREVLALVGPGSVCRELFMGALDEVERLRAANADLEAKMTRVATNAADILLKNNEMLVPRAEAAEARAKKLAVLLRKCKTAFHNQVELQLLPHGGYDEAANSLAQQIHEALADSPESAEDK